MSQHMVRYGMDPQMMWGDPYNLGAVCKQWTTEKPPTGVTSLKNWCSSMVAWMNAHVSSWSSRASWGDWMMHGSMMGREP
jgi:hypothetical protein